MSSSGSAFVSDSAIVRNVLQSGHIGLWTKMRRSGGQFSGHQSHHFKSDPWRTSSPLHQNLGFRYTQAIWRNQTGSGHSEPRSIATTAITRKPFEISFDPQTISYRKLLEFYDPSTLNRQGNDRGASYRSAIFYTSDEQKRIAEDHHCRCRCFRPLAGQGCHRGGARRTVLGGRAGASGLSGEISRRLHLSLHPAELDAAAPGGESRSRRERSFDSLTTGSDLPVPPSIRTAFKFANSRALSSRRQWETLSRTH
jgi:hypothetical protein